MGERKVLNKYIPPEFDPADVPRRTNPKNGQIKVRMMLPMSIRCNTCGNYIYTGTKFNSRKEDASGETYLGIQIFRFYFKCPRCSAELTMKTDPQNSDYTVEWGATRNFEPWRAEDEDQEEMGDAMKSLENRTRDSKREMDILADLDHVKSMNSIRSRVTADVMLEALQHSAEEKERRVEAQDEALVKAIFRRTPKEVVRRIHDEEDIYEPTDSLTKHGVAGNLNRKLKCGGGTEDPSKPKFICKSSTLKISVKKKKKKHLAAPTTNLEKGKAKVEPNQGVSAEAKAKDTTVSTGLQSLLQTYYDSDEGN